MLVPLELTHPQGEMLEMKTNRVPFPLFTGGYGCGKSEILAVNAVRDVMEFAGCYVACYAPTLDLLDLNLVPRIIERLIQLKVRHKMNNTKHILHIQGGRQIIFRSMNDPSRIVAYEVYCSHVDEADLMINIKKATEAWDRIIARNRQKHPDKTKHFNMVSAYSTPEGYKFTYKRWEKDAGEGYKYVIAPSSSNWNLDETFVKNLRDTYTPEQCIAYLEGRWTNIFTGSVYSYFDKERHNTNQVLRKNDAIIAGCDFNYGGSCVSIYKGITEWSKMTKKQKSAMPSKTAIRKAQNKMLGLVMVDEFAAQDTEQMAITLKEDYAGHAITIYPDATGDKGSSNAAPSDIAILKRAGFLIKAKSTNPRIVDRINSLQRLLFNDLFKINTKTCPKTTESLQEHAYSEITGLPEKFAGAATIDDRNDSAGYPPAFLFPIKKTTTTRRDL